MSTFIAELSNSDKILFWNAIATVTAIVFGPLVALIIGGIFQRRADTKKQKLTILGTLLALRHDPTAPDAIRSLNLIDAVFANDYDVREAWTKYFSVLNDGALNNPVGWSQRAEKRHELLMAIVSAVKLRKKISSADLLRTYTPSAVGNQTVINYWEQQLKLKQIQEILTQHGIPIEFVRSVLITPPQEAPPPADAQPIHPTEPPAP